MSVFGDIISTPKPVLITFYAGWHYLTEEITETLEKIAVALTDSAKILKMDIDKNREITKALKINGIPTFLIYHRGELVWRAEGEQTADKLIAELNKYV
ncbi:MAG: thioredoxin domain-containing protein [Capnocytophaga sp.]|nr:thioredoxin domain-containing protein [Capnocytophaga sp.]